MSGSAIIGLLVAAFVGYLALAMLIDKRESTIVDSVTIKRIEVGNLRSRPKTDSVLWLIVHLRPYASPLWSRSVQKAIKLFEAERPLIAQRIMPYGTVGATREDPETEDYYPTYRCRSLHAFYQREPSSFEGAFAELKRIVEITNQLATEEGERVRVQAQAEATARQSAVTNRESELERLESAATRALRKWYRP